MSTVTEIESAIEQLPMEQVREVADWLEEYQATINASAEVFTMLDAEADGLPVIRATSGIITSALVREVEGLGA